MNSVPLMGSTINNMIIDKIHKYSTEPNVPSSMSRLSNESKVLDCQSKEYNEKLKSLWES